MGEFLEIRFVTGFGIADTCSHAELNRFTFLLFVGFSVNNWFGYILVKILSLGVFVLIEKSNTNDKCTRHAELVAVLDLDDTLRTFNKLVNREAFKTTSPTITPTGSHEHRYFGLNLISRRFEDSYSDSGSTVENDGFAALNDESKLVHESSDGSWIDVEIVKRLGVITRIDEGKVLIETLEMHEDVGNIEVVESSSNDVRNDLGEDLGETLLGEVYVLLRRVVVSREIDGRLLKHLVV
jgi:hypothetical protein